MKERPLEDQDKQPEGGGLCLIIAIVLLVTTITFISIVVYNIANEPPPYQSVNPYFKSK